MEFDDRPAIKGGWILLAFLLFFPAGLILVAIRLWKHRELSYQKVLDLKNAGATLFTLFGLSVFPLYFTLSFAVQEKKMGGLYLSCIAVILFLLLPGLFMLWKSGQKRKQLFALYDHYRHIVATEGITSIQTIVEMTKQRPAVVANDLRRLIYLGAFQDAFVDMHSMTIVMKRTAEPPERDFSSKRAAAMKELEDLAKDVDLKDMFDLLINGHIETTSSSKTVEKLQPKTVECPGCGSSTLLQPGESKACQYCDSPLTYPKSG
ncbi:hypothetical protein [Paenibacillus tyrfis]|uniref:Uncharacterized protein n=1 Tax=Paenibacillus tyrfis TaxID=1501230 RepID=A0A081P388_9BACL|nr:hypothetical protein [Paenibacillus tyrfis]KEQ25161.1 hypothetical protein ET33_05615 [Paenibacillus tyrfis]